MPIPTPTPPTLTFIPDPPPAVVRMVGSCVITVSGDNGNVTFNDKCGDMNQASREFWKNVTASFPYMKKEICGE